MFGTTAAKQAARFTRSFSSSTQRPSYLDQAGKRYYDIMPIVLGFPLVYWWASSEGFGWIRQAPSSSGQTVYESKNPWNQKGKDQQ